MTPRNKYSSQYEYPSNILSYAPGHFSRPEGVRLRKPWLQPKVNPVSSSMWFAFPVLVTTKPTTFRTTDTYVSIENWRHQYGLFLGLNLQSTVIFMHSSNFLDKIYQCMLVFEGGIHNCTTVFHPKRSIDVTCYLSSIWDLNLSSSLLWSRSKCVFDVAHCKSWHFFWVGARIGHSTRK